MSTDLLVRHAPALTARVGLLGCGVVGSSVARLLLARGELARVAVLRPEIDRTAELPRDLLGGDAWAVVDDPRIEVVVETIGGIELPRRLITRALANGKSVVTANKEVIGWHGRELAQAAEETGVDLLFEGAVCGGIPIVSVLRGRRASENVRRIVGVVNGTTNFVLERMAEGSSRSEAVAEAQRLGYAEADPAADLEGRDAAAKLAILAGVAFDGWVTPADVECTGIGPVERADLAGAAALGFAVKLVAEAGADRLRVRPALVARESSLGRLRGVENEVVVECSVSGRLAFRGPGAGGDPTAGAVAGDVATAVGNRCVRTREPLVTTSGAHRRGLPEPERWLTHSPDGAALVARLERAGIAVERHACFPFDDEVHTAFVTGRVDRELLDGLRIPALQIVEV